MYVLLLLAVPVAAGLLCYPLSAKAPKLRDLVAFVTTTVVFFMILMLYPTLRETGVTVHNFPTMLSPFGLSFRIDWLSLSLASISAFIWSLVSLYSIGYMKHMEHLGRYYCFNLVTFAAVLGTLFAGDLLTLFLFFELLSLTSYVLVVHEETATAMKAGSLYLFMTLAGGLALVFGIMVTFEISGSLTFLDRGVLADSSNLSLAAFIAFIVGFGMKAGMFPVHVWLPAAHPVAPSPASALLSGIMLKVGAFGLLRVIHNLYSVEFLREVGWNNLLMIAAGITIVIGSLLAIAQTDIKRRLAYSSIGQMGYILLGMSLLNSQALVGDIFHIFAHAIMKSCLFLAAGAIVWHTGKRNINELNGIGRQLPLVMICFTMAALAMIGIPPFNGFLSKWLLGLGALESGHPFYASLLLLSSLLNSIYYMPIIINAFFKDSDGQYTSFQRIPYPMLIPIVILALATVLFEVIPANLPLDLSTTTAEALLGGGVDL